MVAFYTKKICQTTVDVIVFLLQLVPEAHLNHSEVGYCKVQWMEADLVYSPQSDGLIPTTKGT